MNKNLYNVETPCYVIDEAKLIKNLEILKSVQDRTECKILLAQKAFSNFNFLSADKPLPCGYYIKRY